MTRFEQIEQYLRGLMPAGEARAFEAEMASDPELATLVQQHRLERQGLEVLVERDLFAKMAAWDRETAIFQQTQPRQTRVRPMVWAWRAAAVLAVAMLGWWLLRDQTAGTPSAEPPLVHTTKPGRKSRAPEIRKPTSNRPAPALQPERQPASGEMAQKEETAPAPIEELPESSVDYAAVATEFYRESDFLPPKGSKGGTAGSSAYNQALDNFQDGKYNDVVSKLKPALNTGTDALQRKELLALSLYKSQQYEAVVPYLTELIASHQSPYAQRAEWALVLTLLHQMPAKQPLLNRVLSGILADPQHPFYLRAHQLEARLH